MHIRFFCPRWGSEHLPWDVFLQKAAAAGYEGIEWGLHTGTSDQELDTVWNLVEKHGLAIIPQHWETSEARFAEHYDRYCAWFDRIKPYPAYKINTQTGKDYFTPEQNIALVNATVAHTAATGIPVVHETHRNKFLFAAHVARDYFARLPQLRITLDVSHWVTVAESYLSDQPEALATAFERTDHLHARIGHTQGPQIPDPRWASWQEVSDIFFGWWESIIQLKKRDPQRKDFSITPEFGPAPYMTQLASGEPICDQWAVNVYVMEQLRKRHL